MKTLIKPIITLQASTKKGTYELTAQLCKKDPNCLTIKARSHSGKDKRIAGHISREGAVSFKPNKMCSIIPRLVDGKKEKIDMVLDLVFGVKRDKFPTINKFGQTEFKR